MRERRQRDGSFVDVRGDQQDGRVFKRFKVAVASDGADGELAPVRKPDFNGTVDGVNGERAPQVAEVDEVAVAASAFSHSCPVHRRSPLLALNS